MVGAAFIDRQFDAICRITPYNKDNLPLTSSLVIRLSKSVKLPALSDLEDLHKLVAPDTYQSTWLEQTLPFMNKTCWVKRYTLHQLKKRKPSRPATQLTKQTNSTTKTDLNKKVTFSSKTT
jgi:hypothetical protein